MLIHGETNFVLVRTLYVLDCHRRRDIRPSRLYVSPRTRLGSIGAPRRALGARKYSVGRTRIIRIIIMKDHLGKEQPMPLFSYVYSRLALGSLPSSILCKKPIHSLQLFFAAAVWLVSPKRRNTLR